MLSRPLSTVVYFVTVSASDSISPMFVSVAFCLALRSSEDMKMCVACSRPRSEPS